MYQSKIYRILRKILRATKLNKIISLILNLGRYEKRFDDALNREIKPGVTFWDIGSNHGIYVEKFLDKLKDNGSIVAFEPNPNLATKLRDRYSKFDNIKIIESAVSNFDGETEFQEGDDELAATSKIGISSKTSYKVKVQDIETLLKILGKPDIVKIDIEGHESHLINKISNNIDKFTNIKFLVEVHFSNIEMDHDSELFFNDLNNIKKYSNEFIWIDPSHLQFQLK